MQDEIKAGKCRSEVKRMSSDIGMVFAIARSLRKRYSLAVFIALYIKKGLTFTQIWDISSNCENKFVTKQGIKLALKELLEMEFIENKTGLLNGKAYATYVLTKKGRIILKKAFK